ncbi:hypothetical protein GCM10025777_32010 [Membranihabitans marinus]|uniref:Uncharacterized protein n=1 Tax=Nesterenkonia rhizosphaerae TaxID=1348272 RepID=A0ABP9FTV2_9MICC
MELFGAHDLQLEVRRLILHREEPVLQPLQSIGSGDGVSGQNPQPLIPGAEAVGKVPFEGAPQLGGFAACGSCSRGLLGVTLIAQQL